ncbi:hypothetical protein MKEN_01139600 [Mycena kentingensis (nom. inval.)]|nr:hypothetical protein MKEN_01139600 [Mycena kentingensis (nom. inval.)]
MPSLIQARSLVAEFSPPYVPVAVFVGGTSGVGQGMAEALAKQLSGRAHIILIGRTAATAQPVLDGLPKPGAGVEGWKHEFVQCDSESMRAIRATCAELRARLSHINFLVLSAAGSKGNSMTTSELTEEGIEVHLATRYVSRYQYLKEVVPLLDAAQKRGQHAHAMSVLGAGFGFAIPKDPDWMVERARKAQYSFTQGRAICLAALKAMFYTSPFNDAMVAYFASAHPSIAFTHIMPGQVLTDGAQHIEMGSLLTPLAFVFDTFKWLLGTSQDDCAQYMLSALVSPNTDNGGAFFIGQKGDIIGARVFDEVSSGKWDESDWRTGYLQGVPVKGYGGPDAGVLQLVRWTEQILNAI